jgi:hypothetical protein
MKMRTHLASFTILAKIQLSNVASINYCIYENHPFRHLRFLGFSRISGSNNRPTVSESVSNIGTGAGIFNNSRTTGRNFFTIFWTIFISYSLMQ